MAHEHFNVRPESFRVELRQPFHVVFGRRICDAMRDADLGHPRRSVKSAGPSALQRISPMRHYPKFGTTTCDAMAADSYCNLQAHILEGEAHTTYNLQSHVVLDCAESAMRIGARPHTHHEPRRVPPAMES